MVPMIQALPDMYQQPLMLSEIEGKKYKEVAIELNMSVSAIKSRILRGREKLHKSMVRCCTIYRNDAGETVDYEQKVDGFCADCED
jgi:RNA polymerase sigma-70 factor (ECF subfamily)